jgi:hypothetical protein
VDVQLFDIGGEVLEARDSKLQETLERVYSKNIRPRCLCAPGGVEMYVARHWRFVVKRLPGSGKSHHPTCPAYELDPRQSGLADLGGAVTERSGGQFLLRVDFPWTRSSRSGAGRERAEARAGVTTQRPIKRMSLQALTHFLFDQAGFNRWSPAMEGKRSQGVLQRHLDRAAADLIVQGVSLADRLYVPEPFTEAGRLAVAQRRREKLSFLQPCEGRYPLGIVIGEFKQVEHGTGGARVWIKHMPDAPLLVARSTWERIERGFASVLESRDADVPHQVRLVMTALVRSRRENIYELDGACLAVASEHWIPVDSYRELPLVQRLVDDGRRFLKPLRFDLRSAATLPNALLLDTGPLPTPLHILSPYMSPAERSAKEAAIAACAGGWTWDTSTAMPDLPRSTWIPRAAGMANESQARTV